MRAVVFDGNVKFHREWPEPSVPKGEVLIQVRLAGICRTDLEIVKGYYDYKGVLGHEFVGVVVNGPKSLRGKRVVGEINCVCGQCDMCLKGLATHCRRRTVLGISGRDGAFADYLVLPERNCYPLPDSLSNEEAVFVEPLAAAYQVLRQVPIDRHMRCTVIGVGRLGLLMAQVLAQTGCRLQVIGKNPRTLEFCEKKGITAFPVANAVPKQDQDLVVECSGHESGLAMAMQTVRPRGTIVLKSTSAGAQPIDLTPIVVNEVTLLGSRCGPFSEAINALARKQVDVLSMISRIMPLHKATEALEIGPGFQQPESPAGSLKILITLCSVVVAVNEPEA